MTVRPLEPTLVTFHNPLLRYVAATRPAFLTASLMACLLGLAAARLVLHHAAQPQQLGGAIRLTIAAMLVHGALLFFGLLIG